MDQKRLRQIRFIGCTFHGFAMSKAPNLRETISPPDEVIQAGKDGNLILFIGAGVSRLLGLPSWQGLATRILEELRQQAFLNYSEVEQLQTLDPKKQLTIATLIAEQNDHTLNFAKHLTGKTEGDSIYNAINDIDCSCVKRSVFEELSQLIWFIWTLRREDDENLRIKVYELWPLLFAKVEITQKEGQKLASHLCQWAGFINNVDEDRKKLLVSIAPYADESHNSYYLLECLAKISDTQPFVANEIWQNMLQGSIPEYPEEAIRKMLANLVLMGSEGKKAAIVTVNRYLEMGSENPNRLFNNIMASSGN